VLVPPDAMGLGVEMYSLGWGYVTVDRGTGEMLQHSDPGEGKRMLFSIEERSDFTKVAMVAKQDIASGAISDVQTIRDPHKLSLYKLSQPPADDARLPQRERGLMMFDRASGATAWRRDQRQAKTARGVSHPPTDHASFSAAKEIAVKVWVYLLARGNDTSYVMFALCYLQNLLFGDLKTRRVAGRLDQ
jgi:hypothetical protein